MRTPLAKITYHWTDGEPISRLAYGNVRETVQANHDRVTLGGDRLDKITVEPYCSHANEWILRVEFDGETEPYEKVIQIKTQDLECRLVHDTDANPTTMFTCDDITGTTGWTLKVNTKKKVKAPGSLDALEAAVSAAGHAAKAAEAAAKAAHAVIAGLRAP